MKTRAVLQRVLVLCVAFAAFSIPTFAEGDKTAKATKPAADKEKSKEGKSSDPLKLMESLRDSAKGKLDAKHKEAVKKLEADLKAVKAGAKATPEQKKAVQDALVGAITGAHKPSDQSVKKLASSLSNGFADGKLSAKDVLAIQEDVVAVLFATHVTADGLGALKADVTAIADASTGAKPNAKALASDAEAVAKSAEEAAKKKK